MKQHALFLITTGKQELSELTAIVRRLPHGQADALHIREKHRGAREIAQWYGALREAASTSGLPLYINDRLDAAAAVGAPGVQLGYTSLPPADARRILAAGTRIGVSVHSPEEAAAAREAGADYVLFGHIFATASKEGAAARGTDALRQVVKASQLPVIAIGGIEPDNTAEVLATGCSGIAILSGVLLHPDPAGRLRAYREAMDRAGARPMQPWLP
ncbi:thiamine phosphate synthase [Gorillibacterium sp. sgz5001074]|uniref:thiamine phosphate synthase n=1 Tax=Gorillibacterium sp. sgz5001074 TaxID=3446695 RepID=UPI003F662E1F